MNRTLKDLAEALEIQNAELADAAAFAETIPAGSHADEESFVRSLDAVTELPATSASPLPRGIRA